MKAGFKAQQREMPDSSNTSPLCRTFANFRGLKDGSSEGKGSSRNA